MKHPSDAPSGSLGGASGLIAATLAVFLVSLSACKTTMPPTDPALARFVLDYDTPVDSSLQSALVAIDGVTRQKHMMQPEQTDVGLLDLAHLKLAMIHPDQIEYAASVAKIGILLAYFQVHPEAASHLDSRTRHELGLMTKASDNEMASKYSHELGLKNIQAVLNSYAFYDSAHGGGLWVGKHYGKGDERYGDPVADHSHAATVRQLLRFYLLLEQGRLVSPEASKTMLEIFASPGIPHDDIKFVKGLHGRHVTILRKWGSWEDWLHDTAIIGAPNRHYVLIALTHGATEADGDAYLADLAAMVDDLMDPEKRK